MSAILSGLNVLTEATIAQFTDAFVLGAKPPKSID